MERIDAHQHYWRVERNDYHWMPAEGPLHNDWLPDDLAPHNSASGIAATVAVQAAQTIEETEFLLELASHPNNNIAGVVGWVDLDSTTALDDIERLSDNPKLLAIRPMLQDLHDPAWILRPQVLTNLKRLPDFGLGFEVLSYPGHLPYAYEALQATPDLRVVIDHLSKPAYTKPAPHFWSSWIERFAARELTALKISGIVTEIGPDWSIHQCQSNIDIVMHAFGPSRLMFGTDWPVCLQVATHHDVVGLAEAIATPMSPSEQTAFWTGTAQKYYRIPDSCHL